MVRFFSKNEKTCLNSAIQIAKREKILEKIGTPETRNKTEQK